LLEGRYKVREEGGGRKWSEIRAGGERLGKETGG